MKDPLEPPAFNPNSAQELPPEFDPHHEKTIVDHAGTPDISNDAEIQWTLNEEKPVHTTNWFRWICFALTLFCAASAVWFTFSAVTEHNRKAQIQLSSATSKAANLTQRLNSDFLKPAEALVTSLQSQIQNKETDLDLILKTVTSDSVTLKPLAIGVSYLPYAFKDDVEFYSPFFQRNEKGQYQLVDKVDYDYSRLAGEGETYDARWFVEGIKNKGGWQEPYYGTTIQDWIAEYSLPIYKTNADTGEQEIIGLILADFSLEEVREMVRKITLNNLAYGYLVSPQGILVSHPDRDLLGEPLIEAYAKDNTNESTESNRQGLSITERVAAGENFIAEFNDEASGQTSIVLHRQVPISDWSFGIVMPENDVYTLAASNKERILYGLISLALAVIFGITTYKYNDFSNNQLPWLVSSLISIFAVIITIIILILFWDSTYKNNHNKLFTVAETLSARGVFSKNTQLIPTGVIVNDIDFPQPQTASVGGIIWQKFALDKLKDKDSTLADKNTPYGVSWPDAKLGTEKLELIREYKTSEYFIRTWRFHVDVELERSIRQFPFDLSEITLRMRSNPQTKALLVPDFDSYDILIPDVKPGVDPQLELSTWKIQNSFFTVEDLSNTKFYGTQIEDLNKSSEISFRIELARQSHAPLVSHFIPVCISSIMMFIVLMIPSDRSAGSVFSVLGYGGSIFFLVSLFHIGLRSAAGIDGFTYLESYYIMLHVVIMLVSLNGFLLMRGSKVKLIHYRNNLIPKIIYWPLTTLTLLASTIVYFI